MLPIASSTRLEMERNTDEVARPSASMLPVASSTRMEMGRYGVMKLTSCLNGISQTVCTKFINETFIDPTQALTTTLRTWLRKSTKTQKVLEWAKSHAHVSTQDLINEARIQMCSNSRSPDRTLLAGSHVGR